jgi:hypothetical protein
MDREISKAIAYASEKYDYDLVITLCDLLSPDFTCLVDSIWERIGIKGSKVCERLFRAGFRCSSECSLLEKACEKGDEEVVLFCLETLQLDFTKGWAGRTPLLIAIMNNDIAIILHLLKLYKEKISQPNANRDELMSQVQFGFYYACGNIRPRSCTILC